MHSDIFLPAIEKNRPPAIMAIENNYIMLPIKKNKICSAQNRFYAIELLYEQFVCDLFKKGIIENDEFEYLCDYNITLFEDLMENCFHSKIKAEEEENQREYNPEEKLVYEKDVQDWFVLETN